MNAATVFRMLSRVPDRMVRAQSGAAFLLERSSCKHPDRLSHVSKFLHWLSPLDALTKDDQRTLGLIAANGRPVLAEDEDGEEAEVEPELDEVF